MYEQERQRAAHLLILLCYTILTIVLTGESLLLGWETEAIVLLLLGVVVCWTVHFTEKFPVDISVWIYFILTMLAFFFYGIHETSIYDMAPVMMVIILIYSTTEMYSIIRLCVVVYFFTMTYDLFFVMGKSMELTPLSITRTLLHFLLVYMAGWLMKVVMQRRRQERKNNDSRIAGLEETNRRTEDFLTNVSHELRTPINAVTGISAVMLKREEDAEKRKEIASIQEAGHRLFSQIEDILDYTEIDTGKMKVSKEPYVLSSLLNDIITGSQMLTEENAPEVIFDVDAKIPSSLVGDARKIKKILRHLIDNAVRFTKKGGVYVRVYTLTKPYGVNLCMEVSDTGIGIEKEDLEKITEKFFKSDGGKNRRTGGLGLGLPIVYGMVTVMEGFMQVDSNLNDGTTVTVSIPQAVADAAPGMVLENRASLSLACYVRLEKYEIPKVREYYNEMISHLVTGLDVPLHRVSDLEELKKLVSVYRLTHLFAGREEYEESRQFLDSLDQDVEIIVVADERFALPDNGRVKLLNKPFYSFMIASVLNAEASGDTEILKEKRMLCPGVKVLVVDDEPMNRRVAEEIFKRYQMQVQTAESGRMAIDLCEREDFDLVFLDHMMPEMDGIETLKRLRKIHTDSGRGLTVIAFTANAVSGAREMFLEEGFDEFVSKPVEHSELEHVLRKVLPKSAITWVDENIENIKKGDKNFEKDSRHEVVQINTKSALAYCKNDMNFYQELLHKFVVDADKKKSEIDHYFKREDYDNYRIVIHALKSTAKMIGADALSELAQELEAAVQNKDIGYVREYHEEMLLEYSRVVDRISETLDGKKNDTDKPIAKNEAEISGDELLERLTELKEGLAAFEIDKSEAVISEMSETVYMGKDVGEFLREVRKDVEDYEFREAKRKVEKLLDRVKGGEM
ncbi:MAG: response regulator [Lachnospiraceae bacterium]|nr:response regulator [Lachnospiraceae bacterium]